MSAGRGAAASATSRLAALASAAGAAVLVAAGLGLGALPSTASTGASASMAPGAATDVAVPASGASLACPGAPTAALGASGSTKAGSSTASATAGLLVTGTGASLTAAALHERPGDVSGDGAAPAAPKGSTGSPKGNLLRVAGDPAAAAAGAATALAAGPVDGGAPVLAGATTSVTTSGDLRGLVATACVAPAEETWLVGGSTGVSRSTRLVIADTGETATTVDVTVLTADGPQQPSALQGLSLGAGEQRSVLLEGVLDGSAAETADAAGTSGSGSPLAVRVSSSAGPVAAWLVEGVLRGLVPGGQEVVAPAAPPSTSLLVPGVVVAGPAPAVLRVANPGSEPVVARFSVIDGDGASVPAGATPATAVPPGSVVDVELPSLPSGGVGLAVDADGPVLAAARTDSAPSTSPSTSPSTGSPPVGDLAWTAAADPLTGPALVTLPPGTGRSGAAGAAPEARLVLTSGDAATAVDIAVVSADGRIGAPRRVALPATTTTAADVDDLAAAAGSSGSPAALLLTPVGDGGSGVVAAITSRLAVAGGSDLVAASPVRPGAQGRSSVPVTIVAP